VRNSGVMHRRNARHTGITSHEVNGPQPREPKGAPL
jgi:hypothetical protein